MTARSRQTYREQIGRHVEVSTAAELTANRDVHQGTQSPDDDDVVHDVSWFEWFLGDVRRLLAHDQADRLADDELTEPVREVYRDQHDRYVLVLDLYGDRWFLAEWPKSPAAIDTWTDQTVLAADNPRGAVTLLALTPTDDGRMRTDPVPMQPRSFREAFSYGYGGGTPGTTHTAILRCVLGDDLANAIRASGPDNQLWETLSTTQGPLRLPWPQVQSWAHAAHQAGQHAPHRVVDGPGGRP